MDSLQSKNVSHEKLTFALMLSLLLHHRSPVCMKEKKKKEEENDAKKESGEGRKRARESRDHFLFSSRVFQLLLLKCTDAQA